MLSVGNVTPGASSFASYFVQYLIGKESTFFPDVFVLFFFHNHLLDAFCNKAAFFMHAVE